MDYADAFKQLKVSKRERKFLGGKACEGYFVYKVVCFGVMSGPLTWGRVAGLCMRITSTIHQREQARIQCFVDDPALTVGGTKAQRTRLILRTVILWLTLGLRLAWKKGARGRNVEWIGARLRPWRSHTKVPGATIGIMPEQVAKLATQCEAIWACGPLIPMILLRQLAGLASWMSSLMPQLAACTAMLWAAAATARNNRVTVEQIRLPITWLHAFSQQNLVSLERHCRFCAPYMTLITFDGSLTGGGATLQSAYAPRRTQRPNQ